MKVKHYKEIAKLTGSNAVEAAVNLRKWASEPLGGEVSAPIMVQAYIASDLATRIALPTWLGYLETDETAIGFRDGEWID